MSAVSHKYELLRHWLREPAKEYTLPALSKLVGLSHIETFDIVADLMKVGVVECRGGGRPPVFRLTNTEEARRITALI